MEDKKLVGRKYLNDLGSSGTIDVDAEDRRHEKWTKEREVYGFDERDTWSLDYTMVELLYERLKMFMEYADEFINLEYHTFVIDDEDYTQKELIEEMIVLSERLIKDEDVGFEESADIKARIWLIWHVVHPAMWW